MNDIIEIQCSPAVTHQEINEYRNYCPQNCNNCRLVMQKALMIVTEATESRRENFEISCYGDHICFSFWSGSRGNKIVVQMVDDEIHTNIRQTWREWLKEIFT